MRPEIELVIPIQKETEQLAKTVDLIEQYTTNYKLTLVEEPNLNVSECRQKAMDEIVTNNLICFLDDDSEMCMDGWLDEMYDVLIKQQDAGAVFGGEWWGTDVDPMLIENDPLLLHGNGLEVDYGPAACMLMDTKRLPITLKWDNNIGLRSGWLGGDFEEVDYCFQMTKLYGLKLYRAINMMFHHTGGKGTHIEFKETDRFKTVNIMSVLLNYKYVKAPEDEDWFKGLKYVKARDDNDCYLANGQTLRECYHDVIVRNGLTYIKSFNRMGLV